MGPAAGGTMVTITGTNFVPNPDTNVTIGGNAATAVNVVDAMTLTCTTPMGAVGAANVIVTTPNGSSIPPGTFTYTPAPPAYIDVAVGDRVQRGQVIGAVGSRGRSTGPHLCWRLKWRDRNLDPAAWTAAVAAPVE